MAEQLRTFLRLKQVKAATGMSRSWIYEAISRGEFPESITLGARAKGWIDDEIAALSEARIAGKANDEIRALVAKLKAARKSAS